MHGKGNNCCLSVVYHCKQELAKKAQLCLYEHKLPSATRQISFVKWCSRMRTTAGNRRSVRKDEEREKERGRTSTRIEYGLTYVSWRQTKIGLNQNACCFPNGIKTTRIKMNLTNEKEYYLPMSVGLDTWILYSRTWINLLTINIEIWLVFNQSHTTHDHAIKIEKVKISMPYPYD